MDNPAHVAFNESAPADERRDAQTQIQKAHTPRTLSDLLIPPAEIQPVIDHILADLEDQDLRKAGRSNIIPFPSRAAEKRQPTGMQSVYLDDLQINAMGDWYEKPGMFTFNSMRAMVDQTPILSAVVMTRIRQVQSFCQDQDEAEKPGFQIMLKDRKKNASKAQKKEFEALENFFSNCGWESKPRQRMRLKRDSFSSLMAKLVRDTLTMDSVAIETEWKRDKKLGLDGMYAVDGATIRLCTEHGYEGDDEIFALQVIDGRIRTAYGYDDLIYVPRNPRSDVIVGGYGMGETELLIRVVSGFLNAFSYNAKFFDSNSVPKGMLHLTGNFTETDLAAFKRMWNAMVKGVNNSWALPVMVSKDQESRAAFENFGIEVNEMMFGKWMNFLASLICAIYSIAPDEINFESFSTGKSSLSGSDTDEKLANSKDKGLRPLLAYFENLFSDYVVSEFGDKYAFRWTGLDVEDEKQSWEEDKLILTANEVRAARGYEKAKGTWGDAPLNPTLLGVWQAEQEASKEDYGDPALNGAGPDEDDPQGDGDGNPQQKPPGGKPPAAGEPIEKSFGLPVLSIDL